MSIQKKIVISLLIVLLCLIWWRTVFYGQKSGFKEIAVADGQTSFTADFDTISSIVVSNNDRELMKRTENGPASVVVTITDASGNTVAECNADTINIHTNGYTSTESSNFAGMPVKLQSGQTYHFRYQAVLQDGTRLENLSFLLYGDHTGSGRWSMLIILLAAAAIIQACLTKRRTVWQYMLLWLTLLIMTCSMMPMLQADDECSAFADAYGYSSMLLHHTPTDSEGYVQLDQSGIVNSGYASYSIPLLRFWTDWQYGNQISQKQTSFLYKKDAKRITPVLVPEILAVTAARQLELPYQMVWILGWLTNIATVGVLMGITYRLLHKNRNLQFLMMLIYLLPSMLIATMSFTGMGIQLSLCMLFISLVWKYYADKRLRLVISAGVVLLLIIWTQYSYVVLLLPLLMTMQETRAEQDSIKKRTEWIICLIALVALISMFATRAGMILNTIIVRTDDFLKQIIAYHYFSDEDMIIVIYTAMAVVIETLVLLNRNNTAENVSAQKRDILVRTVTLVTGFVMLLTSVPIEQDNAAPWGIANGLYGEQLIPFIFLLLPYRWKQTDAITAEKRNRLIAIMTICVCIITVVRLGKI